MKCKVFKSFRAVLYRKTTVFYLNALKFRMAMNKVLCTIFLSIIVASLADQAADQKFQQLAGVSQKIVELSRITLCLAEKGENAEFIAKIYHAYDENVAGIKKNVHGPLTEEQFNALLKIFVYDTYDLLKVIDPQCSGYCPKEENYSHAPQEVSDLGKAVEKLALTLSCLLDDPKPELLGQLPVIIGEAMQILAASSDTSKTSVGILIPEVNMIVKGLQKLSSRCVNIKREC